MALKDWKESEVSNNQWGNEKIRQVVKISPGQFDTVDVNIWGYNPYKSISRRKLKSESQALAFAKNYMRNN